MRYRPTARVFFFFFVFTCLVLGVCGAHEPTGHPFGHADWGNFLDADINSYVWLSRIFVAYYFAYFIVITPLLGLIETPLPTPESISSPVLPQGAAASPEKKG